MATSNIDQQDTMAAVNDSIIEEEETEESSMTLVEHLEELRWRIFKVAHRDHCCSYRGIHFPYSNYGISDTSTTQNSRYINEGASLL